MIPSCPKTSKDRNLTGVQLCLLIALVYAGLILPWINLSPVGGSSEAREIHVAREMFVQREWILPDRNGLMISKPPLFHWVTAGLAHVTGGVNEGTARLTSLIFACGTVFLVALLALELFPLVAVNAPRTTGLPALLAAFTLGTSYEFIRMTSDARVDMIFCFFVVLSIYAIFRTFAAHREGTGRASWEITWKDWFLFYTAVGFAVLAKGPLGLVLPGIITFCAVASVSGVKRAVLQLLRPRLGWLMFIAVAVPWYTLASVRGSYDFIARQLIFENLQRFEGGQFINSQHFFYYVPSILRSSSPWCLFFLWFCLKGAGRRISRNPVLPQTPLQQTPPGKIDPFRLTAVWFFSGLVFFSIASGKRHSYLLPLFPAISLFLSWKFTNIYYSFSERGLRRLNTAARWLTRIFTLLVCLVLAAVSAAPLVDPGRPGPLHAVHRWISGQGVYYEVLLVPLAAMLVFFCFKMPRSAERRIMIVWVALTLFFAVALSTGYAIKNHLKGFDAAAGGINSIIGWDQRLAAVRLNSDEFLDPLLYYLRRRVKIVNPEEEDIDCSYAWVMQEKYMPGFYRKLKSRGIRMQVLWNFNQVVHQARGRKDRMIFLVRCADAD